jgi:hypothetical protein
MENEKSTQEFQPKDPCPHCGFPSLKGWDDLDVEQKILVERLPKSAEYTANQRKKHRYCIRCWYEETSRGETRV